MVTNKAIASQISQIKHFFHCILVVVCPNSSMYLIMSARRRARRGGGPKGDPTRLRAKAKTRKRPQSRQQAAGRKVRWIEGRRDVAEGRPAQNPGGNTGEQPWKGRQLPRQHHGIVSAQQPSPCPAAGKAGGDEFRRGNREGESESPGKELTGGGNAPTSGGCVSKHSAHHATLPDNGPQLLIKRQQPGFIQGGENESHTGSNSMIQRH